MDSNPEAHRIDPISQGINSLTMDPSNQRVTPEPEQQTPKIGTRRILPEILYQIIDCLDWSNDTPTLTCVSLTAKISYDYLAFLAKQEGWVQDGTTWRMQMNLCLGQRLELAPLLKNWIGGDYRVASPKTIAALNLTTVGSEYWETPTNILFLSRAVYGDKWEQEFALPQRHMDYYNMTMPFKYNFVYHTPFFPQPLHDKVNWYEDMAHFIIHDYIMGEWNEESHNDIGGWFDPERIVCTTPHHPQGLGPSELKGKGDGSGFIVSVKDLIVTTAYDRRVPPLPWTYNGRDSFHRAICHQEGATIKDMLKAIERDINESWGISFWETHSSD
ncbi:uncharacterized protein EAF02_007551 [Botrytis sinoallii]|uniref:uncharacterized protein n=1 Tax=Botrytis sinoallii TaxID=1463999 RepID=UPI0019006A2C|nr:uncharacterized protein EAF02_007551 [Botrytis sinoallii]KAF7879914.1 hypothetical protein EAF02_007551 [Botrytis sinoallii]